MYNQDNHLAPILRTFFVGEQFAFCSFAVICSDLAVLIFTMLLADIQSPNWKRVPKVHGVGKYTYVIPSLLYTLLYYFNPIIYSSKLFLFVAKDVANR